MRNQKANSIDLNNKYPCPCRRKGCLLGIALTEALGCDRCGQIFIVIKEGQAIEQLSSIYPYKSAWRWNGKNWKRLNNGIKEHYLVISLGVILVLLIVWLPLALLLPQNWEKPLMILWAVIALILAFLPGLILWLAYRNRG